MHISELETRASHFAYRLAHALISARPLTPYRGEEHYSSVYSTVAIQCVSIIVARQPFPQVACPTAYLWLRACGDARKLRPIISLRTLLSTVRQKWSKVRSYDQNGFWWPSGAPLAGIEAAEAYPIGTYRSSRSRIPICPAFQQGSSLRRGRYQCIDRATAMAKLPAC